MKNRIRNVAAAAILALALSVSAFAETSTVEKKTLIDGIEGCDGIFVSYLSDEISCLQSGGRTFFAGDAIPASYLEGLRAQTLSLEDTVGELRYYPVFGGCVCAEASARLSLRGRRNDPPEVKSCELETYRDIELHGKLTGTDPEGESVRFLLVKEPKHGSVELDEDGNFVFTPTRNRLGSESFTYLAEDASGNQSEPAEITVRIRRPKLKGTFADMAGDPQEFEAMFLRSSGIFSGETVGDTLCFCPEKPVSPTELLMMTMKLTGMEPEENVTEAGWFAPWQTAALRAGITAWNTEEAQITRGEALDLVAVLLDLPEAETVSVFADASERTELRNDALDAAGIPCFADAQEEALTRRDAAILLCAAAGYCEKENVTFPWQK